MRIGDGSEAVPLYAVPLHPTPFPPPLNPAESLCSHSSPSSLPHFHAFRPFHFPPHTSLLLSSLLCSLLPSLLCSPLSLFFLFQYLLRPFLCSSLPSSPLQYSPHLFDLLSLLPR